MAEPDRPASSGPGKILLGAVLLTALGFGALVLWRRPSPPSEQGIVHDVESLKREHAKRLAEDAREDELRKDARSPEQVRERIEKSSVLTPEQKQLILESQATVDRIVEEAKADRKKVMAELDEDARRSRERLKQLKEEKEKNKKSLTFAVDLASSTIFPCQPLVARFRVTNVGDAPVPITFSLDPEHGSITGEIAPAGSTTFQKLPLGMFPECVSLGGKDSPQLDPGTSVSLQSDLSLFLGYDFETRTVSTGSFILRLHLDVGFKGGGTQTSDDLKVTVMPPTGDEQAILDRIVKNGYFLYLGTQGLHTAPRSLTPRSADAGLGDLQSIISQYPGSAYVRDLRAGYFRAVSVWWTGMLKTQSWSDLAAQVKPIVEEYWRRDCPTSWSRAESLLYVGRVCNWAGDMEREKEALARFGQVCPEDARAPSVAKSLQLRRR